MEQKILERYKNVSRERLIQEVEDLDSAKRTAEYFEKKSNLLEKAEGLLDEAIKKKDSAMVTATAELIRLSRTIL